MIRLMTKNFRATFLIAYWTSILQNANCLKYNLDIEGAAVKALNKDVRLALLVDIRMI